MGSAPLVMVADDELYVAETTAAWLLRHEFRVTDPVSDWASIGDRLLSDKPHALVLDLMWHDRDILCDLGALHLTHPNVAIAMHSAFPAPKLVEMAFRLGALGFVFKGEFHELPSAIEAILAGRRYCSTSLLPGLGAPGFEHVKRIIRRMESGLPGEPLYESCVEWLELDSCIPRQQAQICLGIRDGLTVELIALRIGCEPSTVKTYLHRLFDTIEQGGLPRTQGGIAAFTEDCLSRRPKNWAGLSIPPGSWRGLGYRRVS